MYQFLFPSYIDGFSYNQLIDLSGFFYIINPFEKIRNINSGNFINDSGNIEILSEDYIDKFYKKIQNVSKLCVCVFLHVCVLLCVLVWSRDS